MAKANRRIQTRSQGGAFDQQESYDDSLLPDADELAKLQHIDPTIMPWLKERTAKEQDSRHDFTDRRLSLIEKGQKRAYHVDILTIVCAFLLMGGGMFLSYVLLSQKEILPGSVFGGATILFAAKAFLNFRKQEPKPEKPK